MPFGTVINMEMNFIGDCTEEQANTTFHAARVTAVVEMNGKTLYVKKRNSTTLELPSVSVGEGESPSDTLKRLLENSLNTTEVSARFVSAYSIADGQNIRNGVLYLVEISSMRTLNDHELCASYFLDMPPESRDKWTSPETDIPLLEKAMELVKVTSKNLV